MPFNILDYVSDLKLKKDLPTWILAECPVCSGNLKINKLTKAYSCYSSQCHLKFTDNRFNLIKAKLTRHRYIKSPFNQEKKISRLPDFILSKKLTLEDIGEVTNFISTVEYVPLVIKCEDIHEDTVDKKCLIYYRYLEFILVRVDKYFNDNKIEKYFYWLTYTEGKLEKKIPTEFNSLPVYKLKYINKYLIIAEGEKCADSLHKLNLNAISLASFCYSLKYLDKICKLLYVYGVRYVIIFTDNDSVGDNKGNLLYTYLQSNQVICKKINIYTDIVQKYSERNIDIETVTGYDIADYIKDYSCSQSSILKVIEQCLL